MENGLRTEIRPWPRMENCLRAEIRPWSRMENGRAWKRPAHRDPPMTVHGELLCMENCLLNAQGAWKRYTHRIQMERERYEEP